MNSGKSHGFPRSQRNNSFKNPYFQKIWKKYGVKEHVEFSFFIKILKKILSEFFNFNRSGIPI